VSRPEPWGEGLGSISDEALRETNRHWTLARALSDVVHGINNALQVMSGSAELVELRVPDDETARQRLQAIRAQAERAAAAVNELLAYARPGAGGSGAVDLSHLADVAIGMRAHSLGRLRILTTREAGQGPARAMVDAQACLQLFLNVLLWLEARLAGRERAAIAVRCVMAGAAVRVELLGSDAGGAGSSWPVDSAGTDSPQWRVIGLLAASMGAGVERVDGSPGVVVTVPARA
jgi:C4-dicarboxylate-specific signal transduction histidine kinase